jgi:hypothetical protein
MIDEVALVLYAPQTCDMAVDLKHQVLGMGEEVLFRASMGIIVIFFCTMTSNEVMPALYGRGGSSSHAGGFSGK